MSAEDFYRRFKEALTSGGRRAAYVGDGKTHAYADLVAAMERIHALLPEEPGRRVALIGDKRFETYAAIYAIVLSGHCWVPVNPDFPEARVRDMLELAEIDLVLTDREPSDTLGAFLTERGIPALRLARAEAAVPLPFEELPSDPDAVAYIMFTSGSTGRPKGVPMTHGNYIPFIENALALLPFAEGEVFSDYHDFGFDLSIFYLFCCVLVQGAIAPAMHERDRLMPLDHIRRHGVSVLSSVPSLLSRLMAMYRDQPLETPIRILFMCGEPFRIEQLEYCFDRLGLAHVYNFYGLTETGVENFHHPCRREDVDRFRDAGFVPIGTALPGNEVCVGEDDELWIAGPQLMSGYLGGVGRERFVEHDGIRWFRSGDRVERRDGVYFCKGRLDSQVKVSGYRIELMEIEAHLRSMPAVDEAVCFVTEHGARKYIVAGLNGSRVPGRDDVAAFLVDRLPDYMIPHVVFALQPVPLNASGKVDRPAVVEAYATAQEARG